MGSALLSRFDLVFILLDKPDEVKFIFVCEEKKNKKIILPYRYSYQFESITQII